jgi:hypothetical protein
MNTNTANQAEYRRAIAITRKLALRRGIKPEQRVGPEYLAAGLARLLGEKADPALHAAGITDARQLLVVVPDASEAEMDQLPAVRPDERLTRLLQTSLKGFPNGAISVEQALRVLLADREVLTGIAVFVRVEAAEAAPDTQTSVRRLTRLLQRGYQLSHRRYETDSKNGDSDFATGVCDSDFEKVVKEFEAEKHEVDKLVYAGPRTKPVSFFEKNMREFGPLAADVLVAVTVNSVTPFTSREAGILVRDVAWTLRPRFPHEIAPAVVESAKTLQDANKLRVFPEPEFCHLESYLLPTEETLVEFGDFLRREESRTNRVRYE